VYFRLDAVPALRTPQILYSAGSSNGASICLRAREGTVIICGRKEWRVGKQQRPEQRLADGQKKHEALLIGCAPSHYSPPGRRLDPKGSITQTSSPSFGYPLRAPGRRGPRYRRPVRPDHEGNGGLLLSAMTVEFFLQARPKFHDAVSYYEGSERVLS